MREPYKPTGHQEFWCNVCDNNVVDSNIPESGKYFLHAGHSYSSRSKEYDGPYVMVMNAVCFSCLEKK